MAVCSKNGIYICMPTEIGMVKNEKIVGSLQFTESKPMDLAVLKSEFKGRQVEVSDQRSFNASSHLTLHAESSMCVSRALKWWDKILKPNMIEINSAQQLVDTLNNAGDKLVILDFYSPGCGGCKALHPKICQFAETNPNALFLKVNYEELKPMCYSLNVHVLPFFRFYRGTQGRVCSFSCTNATIKKFKDALAKHGTQRSSLGPAKGLEETELMKLASIGEISFDYSPTSTSMDNIYNYPSVEENKIEVIQGNLSLV